MFEGSDYDPPSDEEMARRPANRLRRRRGTKKICSLYNILKSQKTPNT